MEHVQWVRRPALHRPALVTAFSGWNDAGDAASNALRYLIEQCDAELVAKVEGDDFYDYGESRPTVRIVQGDTRDIEWPELEIYAADVAGRSADPDVGDLLLLVGPEPQLRWRSLCRGITALAVELGASRAMHLGALLAEVPHSRPVPMVGSGGDRNALAARGLEPSRYEGPTGIVGVLHAACVDAGIESTSLWAAVPGYVSGAPSPKATLALVEHAAGLLHLDVPRELLEVAAETYEREVDALVADDDDMASYVHRLEISHDLGDDPADDLDDGDEEGVGEHAAARLAEEVERFLRDQHGER